MSNAAKQSLLILIILLLAAVGYTALTVMEKQQTQQAKVALEKQLEESQQREKEYVAKQLELGNKIKEIETAKAELEEKLKNVDVDVDSIDATIKKLTGERDDWKTRVGTLTDERDKLIAKLKEMEEAPASVPSVAGEKAVETKVMGGQDVKVGESLSVEMVLTEDDYWAQVLKERAAMQLELDKLKSDMNGAAIEIGELKKENSDLQMEISKITNEKDIIEREIKAANDLSDTLSLELARAKNEKKFVNERFSKAYKENATLRGQIKQLTSTKVALEKTIVRLQEEKKDVQKKLSESENVIQGRIDEIWEIKDSLEKTFEESKVAEQAKEVELPPIIVSNSRQNEDDVSSPDASVGYQGNIVSINDENNFVIIDIGENAGLAMGETLNVYRGAEYVAGIEVIQLRKDISAADIKNQVAKIKVGDIVK